ncbi:MAG TPA: FAD:protein FMN transferase [Gaiellaceae bacterium]|nr:FAD:protein FMN transferase [Gaiellaceae bacterium]
MLRHRFRAMGTEVELLVEAHEAGAELAAAEAAFHRLEAVLSRFRPASELSRLNAAGAIDASPDLARVVALAVEARERTGGLFDPTVHDAVVAAGYDRTFAELPDDGPPAPAGAPCGGSVSVRGRRIELGAGVRLDLGGIGKGFAVDRAVAALAPAGPCLVDAGGDLAVSGVPAGGVWPVGVDLPDGRVTVGLEAGALATSGRDRRRWRRGGEERHHLVDPRTGRPAGGPILRATALAASAVEAEVLAKALFLGADPAGATAVLVRADGSVAFTGALA